ncbi:MAG: hypothetical protein FJ291_18690 [Planctomycetes bacterium]|nr:hypothetical protein [Planctomycetota bacterium]
MRVIVAGLVGALLSRSLLAGNAMTPGRLVPEPPTLICLGVCWYIQGDDNCNATGELTYRKAGEDAWRKALPLLRVDPRKLYGGRQIEPMLAGTVFDLAPGTDYELKVRISDPDGGEAEQVVRQRTRSEPQTPRDARELHVAPGDGGGSGTKADPFKGFAALQKAVQPGDLVLVHAGTYKGPIQLTRSGEEGRPITYRGAGDGEAIFEGGGDDGDVLVIYGTRHLIFERLTLRSGLRAFHANGCQGLTVRRCTITRCRFGIRAIDARSPARDFTITDNAIASTTTWPRTKGIEDIEGLEINGTGHAVAYNRITNCGDCFSFRDPASASDVYNNVLEAATDDAIELDETTHNARAFRNRITDCHMGVTTQPVWGGPAYIIRNAFYNTVGSPLKLHNEPSGIVILHNTSVKSAQAFETWTKSLRNVLARNNLFLGTERYAAEVGTGKGEFEMANVDFDYNGYSKSPDATRFMKWGDARYATIEEVRQKAAIEKHGVIVALDIFASKVLFPDPSARCRPPDLRLREGSAACDAGQVLPNINDGFGGKAPDLGAYELGDKLPHYGPRPE